MFYQQKSKLVLRDSNKSIGGQRVMGPYWPYASVGQCAWMGLVRRASVLDAIKRKELDREISRLWRSVHRLTE